MSGERVGLIVWPVAAAAAAFAKETAATRADFGLEVTERRRAFPATRVLHAGFGVPDDGVKLPIRIRRHAHGVRAEDQALGGHHFVELAAWPGDVVESGLLVIAVAPRGMRMDLEQVRVVLDAHHGANGEGDWPAGGGWG